VIAQPKWQNDYGGEIFDGRVTLAYRAAVGPGLACERDEASESEPRLNPLTRVFAVGRGVDSSPVA
jgi:hypothetical protein